MSVICRFNLIFLFILGKYCIVGNKDVRVVFGKLMMLFIFFYRSIKEVKGEGRYRYVIKELFGCEKIVDGMFKVYSRI